MSHEIYEHDSLALNRTSAWHGLGNVITHDMNPTEALTLADLDWEVEFPESQRATFSKGGVPIHVPVSTTRTLFRVPRDGRDEPYLELGTHKKNYTPLQNRELFDIAYAIDEDVKVESAGSMFNGKRIFCLLRGDTINFGHDEVVPYVALMNSHDGTLALSAMPTSIRIVCNNTLSMALTTGRKKMFKVRHCQNIDSQIEELKSALSRFRQTGSMFKERVEDLRSKELNEQKLLEFWTKAYSYLNGTPTTKEELEETTSVLDAWRTTFETERATLNEEANMWLAANAVTDWIQHKEPKRKTKTYEERNKDSNLWGVNQDDSVSIMNMALKA
jgi:phage/plasmid-like protein (TIGR03299 family)